MQIGKDLEFNMSNKWNAPSTYYLGRSQPPFLSAMMREYYDITRDKTWLKYATHLIWKIEYNLGTILHY